MIGFLKKYLTKKTFDNPLIHGSIQSLIGNGIGRIGSLAVSIIIASKCGATIYTDAFFMVFAIVAFFSTLFQGSLDLSFIPVYSEVRNKRTPETGKFLGSMIFNIFWVTLGFAILMACRRKYSGEKRMRQHPELSY